MDHSYEAEVRPAMAPGGQYVILNGAANDWTRRLASAALHINVQRKNTQLVLADSSTADLELLGRFAAAGTLSAVVQQTMEMDDVPVAFAFLKSRRVRGKLVICMGDERP